MYKKVELKDGFVGMENQVAKTWKEKDIIKMIVIVPTLTVITELLNMNLYMVIKCSTHSFDIFFIDQYIFVAGRGTPSRA